MTEHAYHLQYGRNKLPKPDPDKVKELAAQGKTRQEIATAVGVPYKRFSYFVNNYYSLNKAYKEGVRLFKEKQDAEKQTQTR